jgi:hypothetical protein
MTDFDRSHTGPLLADLLMGAAYADAHFDGQEGDVVRQKLATWLEVEELPEEIEKRLETFDHEAFDLFVTVSLLARVAGPCQPNCLHEPTEAYINLHWTNPLRGGFSCWRDSSIMGWLPTRRQ